MTAITAQMVKQLNDRTGVGMMECKKALLEAEGDEGKAIEILQIRSKNKLDVRAAKIAAEGMVYSYLHGTRIGVMLELNCQTDFVARGPEFKAAAEEVAMHIASANPKYLRRDEVPAGDIEKQMGLIQASIAEEDEKAGKKRPANVVETIAKGKLDKWFSETCLEEQSFVTRESDVSIKSVLDELSTKTGEKIVVRRFVRFECGEGIEKKVADLAADVAATIAQQN